MELRLASVSLSFLSEQLHFLDTVIFLRFLLLLSELLPSNGLLQSASKGNLQFRSSLFLPVILQVPLDLPLTVKILLLEDFRILQNHLLQVW